MRRRALGGGTAYGPFVLTSVLGIGALAWIGLAAMQVASSPVDPALTAWASGGIAILLVLGAATWDAAAIRRLGKGLERWGSLGSGLVQRALLATAATLALSDPPRRMAKLGYFLPLRCESSVMVALR